MELQRIKFKTWIVAETSVNFDTNKANIHHYYMGFKTKIQGKGCTNSFSLVKHSKLKAVGHVQGFSPKLWANSPGFAYGEMGLLHQKPANPLQ